MAEAPVLKLTSTVLDAPDAAGLAAFYRRLLGWVVDQEEPDWPDWPEGLRRSCGRRGRAPG